VGDEIQMECDDGENVSGKVEDGNIDGECSALSLRNLGVEKTKSSQTLSLKGRVHELPLFILVNSGASHNFISRRLVDAMGWQWETT